MPGVIGQIAPIFLGMDRILDFRFWILEREEIAVNAIHELKRESSTK
jgi:hypothetical protein